MTKKMLMAVACLGAAVASAQTMETVKVTLPMDAKIGKVSLPAGEYSIKELNSSVLEIQSAAHHGNNAFVQVNSITTASGAAAEHTKVVLKKDANGYQLQTIWIEGQELGFELSSAE
jgi:hypothetical protein